MKKAQIFVILIFTVLVLSVGVYAGNHPDKDFDIKDKIKQKTKDKFDDYILDNISHSELMCDVSKSKCYFSMWQENFNHAIYGNKTYNLGTHQIPLTYCNNYVNETCVQTLTYNDNQLENNMEDKMVEWLDSYGDVLDKRDNVNHTREEKVNKGKTKTKQ